MNALRVKIYGESFFCYTNTIVIPEISSQIASAVSLLRAGKIVAFPTETVYGLGRGYLYSVCNKPCI